MTVGFIYAGQSYNISSCMFEPDPNILVYTAKMDVSSLDFRFGEQAIPSGATITLTNSITFVQDNGFENAS